MTLGELVQEYILQEGRDALHKYPVYLQYAIRGLKDLNNDVSGVPTVAVIPLDEMNRGTLPKDMINVMKVGVLGTTGEVVQIYRNDNLAIIDGLVECNSPMPQVIQQTQTIGYPNDWVGTTRSGEDIGRQYGVQGGSRWGYRIDTVSGFIQVSTNLSGAVILEYLSSLKTIGGKYHVHPFLEEPIMSFIYYASIRYRKEASRLEKREAYRDYINKKHHANVQFMSESVAAIINNSRKTFTQVGKF